MGSLKINYIAVFVLVLLHQAAGALWYSPAVFGNLWVKYSGVITNSSTNTTMPYVAALIVAFLICYGMAYLIARLEIDSVGQGARFGFFIWLVFMAPVVTVHYMFALKSITLILLDIGLDFFMMPLTGAILVIWSKNKTET